MDAGHARGCGRSAVCAPLRCATAVHCREVQDVVAGTDTGAIMIFDAPRPGAWLRSDISDILTALALTVHEDEYARGYTAALVQVAIALGLRVQMLPSLKLLRGVNEET